MGDIEIGSQAEQFENNPYWQRIVQIAKDNAWKKLIEAAETGQDPGPIAYMASAFNQIQKSIKRDIDSKQIALDKQKSEG
ncbi:MAG: hypothetical protein JAY60_18475 [Candidatus Thiodiazotropha weberae]|nr:hypothetical protein [Candidatus Thiodiazotropha weberae]